MNSGDRPVLRNVSNHVANTGCTGHCIESEAACPELGKRWQQTQQCTKLPKDLKCSCDPMDTKRDSRSNVLGLKTGTTESRRIHAVRPTQRLRCAEEDESLRRPSKFMESAGEHLEHVELDGKPSMEVPSRVRRRTDGHARAPPTVSGRSSLAAGKHDRRDSRAIPSASPLGQRRPLIPDARLDARADARQDVRLDTRSEATYSPTNSAAASTHAAKGASGSRSGSRDRGSAKSQREPVRTTSSVMRDRDPSPQVGISRQNSPESRRGRPTEVKGPRRRDASNDSQPPRRPHSAGPRLVEGRREPPTPASKPRVPTLTVRPGTTLDGGIGSSSMGMLPTSSPRRKGRPSAPAGGRPTTPVRPDRIRVGVKNSGSSLTAVAGEPRHTDAGSGKDFPAHDRRARVSVTVVNPPRKKQPAVVVPPLFDKPPCEEDLVSPVSPPQLSPKSSQSTAASSVGTYGNGDSAPFFGLEPLADPSNICTERVAGSEVSALGSTSPLTVTMTSIEGNGSATHSDGGADERVLDARSGSAHIFDEQHKRSVCVSTDCQVARREDARAVEVHVQCANYASCLSDQRISGSRDRADLRHVPNTETASEGSNSVDSPMSGYRQKREEVMGEDCMGLAAPGGEHLEEVVDSADLEAVSDEAEYEEEMESPRAESAEFNEMCTDEAPLLPLGHADGDDPTQDPGSILRCLSPLSPIHELGEHGLANLVPVREALSSPCTDMYTLSQKHVGSDEDALSPSRSDHKQPSSKERYRQIRDRFLSR